MQNGKRVERGAQNELYNIQIIENLNSYTQKRYTARYTHINYTGNAASTEFHIKLNKTSIPRSFF